MIETMDLASQVCNGAALRKASRRVTQLYDSVLAPCGLGVAQRVLMVHISRLKKPTISELARDLALDRSTLGRNLKLLERDGYIELVRDEQDARNKRVLLTRAGQAKLQHSDLLWCKAQSQFELAYGKKRATELRTAMAELFSDAFWNTFEQARRSA